MRQYHTVSKETFGSHDQIIVSDSYVLPGREDHTEYEKFAAKRIYEDLNRRYPGHAWFVECDMEKGGVTIALPVLMGSNWVYFIRFADLTEAKVLQAGGEILERYRLRRGRFELPSFLDARAKHSILLNRSRKVPT